MAFKCPLVVKTRLTRPALPPPLLPVGQRRLRVILKKFREGHPPDVEEGPCTPSAPPFEFLEPVRGYEGLSFLAMSIPPPEGENGEEEEEEDGNTGKGRKGMENLPSIHEISEEEARQALHKHAQHKTCYGTTTAKRMAITKIISSSAFHYELQTFTEKRETSWAFTPYGGGGGGEGEDGSHNGAPLPWDIPASPSRLFHDEVKVLDVPGTTSIKECHRCRGAGSLLCNECHGKGWTACMTCHGDGWRTDSHGQRDLCFYCQSSRHGHGKQDCLQCNAHGCVACPTCDGFGQLRCFIRLTITWKTTTSEHIVERSCLPEGCIRTVSGQVAFEEEHSRVLPLRAFPDETIKMASAQLVQDHAARFHDQRILAQRHQVRIVPVANVHYEWKHYVGHFLVYGFEQKVHCPDYPQTCCWGCQIL